MSKRAFIEPGLIQSDLNDRGGRLARALSHASLTRVQRITGLSKARFEAFALQIDDGFQPRPGARQTPTSARFLLLKIEAALQSKEAFQDLGNDFSEAIARLLASIEPSAHAYLDLAAPAPDRVTVSKDTIPATLTARLLPAPRFAASGGSAIPLG